jgi:hypothetical protein
MNTVEDFLDTVNSLEADITCPSCGSHMAAQLQGSYELILTPQARNEFNNVLSLHRAFLLDLEEQLSTYNLRGIRRNYGLPYPYEGDKEFGVPAGSGLFAGDFAMKLRDHLAAFDRYERKRLIEELPLAADADEFAAKMHQVIVNVLLGLEPNLIIGPLANVILGQRHVASWIHAMVTEKPPEGPRISQVLQQVCPTIADYLEQLEQEATPQPVSAGSASAGASLNGQVAPGEVRTLVRRAELLLVLLLGHRADDTDKITMGFMRKDDPYRLPAEVQVQSRFLADIATAAVLLRRGTLRLSDDFRHLVSDGKFGKADANGGSATPDIARLIAEHGREVGELVRFACTGEPSWLPPEVAEAIGSRGAQRFDLEEQRRRKWRDLTITQRVDKTKEILGVTEEDSSWSSGQVWFEATRPLHCGWYPKHAPTYGVTLLGGPGVGKSTVMTSGLPTFARAAFGLGLRIKFEDADDNLMYSAYDELYWRGFLPSPTELGVRHSIEFYAEQTGAPSSRTHFVFTDIPGEIVAAGIQDPGTHPIIYNSLRHARTIVFFLDLTLERDIRESILLNKEAAEYPGLAESAKNTREDRGGTPEGAEKPQPSKADVSQKGLLYQLIEDLREIHGEDGLKEISIILVIPKADLYACDDSEPDGATSPSPFLQSFFRKMRSDEILKQSPYSHPGNGSAAGQSIPLSSMRSDGAAPPVDEDPTDDVAQLGKRFADRLRTISDAAKGAMEGVRRDKTAGSDAETRMLGNFFHFGLIQALESIFTPGHVYFLPVSAAGAGKQEPLKGKPGRKPGRKAAATPPNQMLPELIFAAPILITLRRSAGTAAE